jgi:class 3 adenylate cyclase/tetratricopeptide (TPR) repeat protein
MDEALPAREQRKTVTVLFCDVTGSTALGEQLDPEPLRALLARYFDRVKGIVEQHEGSVEKFIGDAVMAVFGVPVLHEDDALRAVRAALEMRAALPELGVGARLGIATGEVVVGTAERLATGDVVNLAARLEQSAAPGEILIAEPTYRLVRDVVSVAAVEPLAVRGKSLPVTAYRLLSVGGGAARGDESPMVGREREQRLLSDAWERVVAGPSCHLFTILGVAGVGKSRLAAEFLATVDQATVVRGRCLPYGEGITYWPVVEVLKQLPDAEVDEAKAAPLRALLREGALQTSSEEIAWAVRKRLEAAASEVPLVCVFDDLQWGEETFLDLVEHVADLSRDAAILLVCMARPDLLDRRAGWGGGKLNATSVLLEPLDAEETDRLIESLADVDSDLRERIRETAEGNPLFVEEMVAMLRESPDRVVAVPPTIQALLAARLDQLDPRERAVLQCGSIEGRIFHRGTVQALATEVEHVQSRLTALVRKELVRPDKPQLPGEDAYRFRHLLIRDAAYDALSKANRAELHERFADWLDEHGATLVELDEIVGHHLEQAWACRRELGFADDADCALSQRAAGRLIQVGRAARERGDLPAAASVLGRASALLGEEDSLRREVLADLGQILVDLGQYDRAASLLAEASASAEAAGDERILARTALSRIVLRAQTEILTAALALPGVLDAAAILERVGDEAGQAWASLIAGQMRYFMGDVSAAEREYSRALELAQRAGDRARENEVYSWGINAKLRGPAPVSEGLAYTESAAAVVRDSRQELEWTFTSRALLLAMQGRFDESKHLAERSRHAVEELGLVLDRAVHSILYGEIALLAEDPVAAEHELRTGYVLLERLGDKAFLATLAPLLAESVLLQGRHDEAVQYLDAGERAAAADDVDAWIRYNTVGARIHAARGEIGEAEHCARQAVALAASTEYVTLHADALLVLADVLSEAGRAGEGVAPLQSALDLYERKGNTVMAERTHKRLAEISA